MIQFLNPVWLWALTGLLIPIGIHLLSRKEGKTIPIGSLRHFDESVTAQFRSIRLNEVLLLIIRCALITSVVLLLAGIHFNSASGTKKRWAVAEPGIAQNKEAKQVLDSLRTQGYSIHSLTPGFPEATEADTLQPDTRTNYWAAIEALKSIAPHEVVILSYAYARNFRGQRPALPSNFRWLSFTPPPATYTAAAVTLSPDSLWVRTGESSAQQTVYQTQRIAARQQTSPAIDPTPADSIAIAVVTDKGFEYDRNIILASLKALQSATPHTLAVTTHEADTYKPTATGWTIWLAATPPPAFSNSNNIVFMPCGVGYLPVLLPAREATLNCHATQPYGWIITRHLNEASVLRENLVLTLASIITPATPAEAAINNDNRVLPEPLLAAAGAVPGTQQTKAAAGTTGYTYWAVLIFLFLVAERWLAAKRNQ